MFKAVTGMTVGKASITTTNDTHASEMTLTNHINAVPLPKLNGPGMSLRQLYIN